MVITFTPEEFPVGSKVAIHRATGTRIVTISKYTLKGYVQVEEIKHTSFTPEGVERGHKDFYKGRLQELTPELKDKIIAHRLRRKISSVDWDTIPIQVVKDVLRLLPTKE